jgi:hypothetical protein
VSIDTEARSATTLAWPAAILQAPARDLKRVGYTRSGTSSHISCPAPDTRVADTGARPDLGLALNARQR